MESEVITLIKEIKLIFSPVIGVRLNQIVSDIRNKKRYEKTIKNNCVNFRHPV